MFKVSATVDDPNVIGEADFTYKILDNENYIVNSRGVVEAKDGYTPQIGDKITVEVIYTSNGKVSRKTRTFTVKI
jgi:hypothetical protein